MNFDEIETAIGQHLEAMDDAPDIAWPNKDFTPSGTYIEFRMSPTAVTDPVIDGDYEYETGLALLTVVSERGKFTGESNAMAQKIADRFPKALRLPITGGNVVINAPTSRGSSFQDGAYWRQPVRVSYITE